MPTTLTYTLPSNVGCAPLCCGVDDRVFLSVKPAAQGKVADASGYVSAVILTAKALSLTSWEYAVSVPDDQMIPGQTLTSNDVEPTLSCITGADDAILAKSFSTQSYQLLSPPAAVTTANLWIARRHRAFDVVAMEIAIGAVTGTPEITIQLQKSGANNNTLINIGAPIIHAITTPVRLTNRYTFAQHLTLASAEAISLSVTITGGTATGLDLTLITAELP